MDEQLPEELRPWHRSLAAASQASEAAAELLRCIREDDVVLVEEVALRLADAARLVLEIDAETIATEAHNQLLGALQRWLGEYGD
ncbi:MAG: hypothetical protein IT481_08365 [Gammaproteobacteria bacterium]|nr:hypothetical protein [Gammaproteobacteria bacterium]